MIEELVGKLKDPWSVLGWSAQLIFASRFVVQWIASERRKKSVFPIAFWYLSLFGSAGLFVYAIIQAEPVFIFAQAFGSVVYVRNLVLIYRHRRGDGQDGLGASSAG